MRDTVKVVILLSMSFIMVTVENWLKGIVPISGLLAVMSMGIMINKKYLIKFDMMEISRLEKLRKNCEYDIERLKNCIPELKEEK